MREDSLSETGLSVCDKWFDAYPQLQTAYGSKEPFFRMYDCPDKAAAIRFHNDWKRRCPGIAGVNSIYRTAKRSYGKILRYFDGAIYKRFCAGFASFAPLPIRVQVCF